MDWSLIVEVQEPAANVLAQTQGNDAVINTVSTMSNTRAAVRSTSATSKSRAAVRSTSVATVAVPLGLTSAVINVANLAHGNVANVVDLAQDSVADPAHRSSEVGPTFASV
jgi:hypothetical protein